MIHLAADTPLGEPPSAELPRKWWFLAALENPSRILVFCSLTSANGIVSDPSDDEFQTARARKTGELLRWLAGERVAIIEPSPEAEA